LDAEEDLSVWEVFLSKVGRLVEDAARQLLGAVLCPSDAASRLSDAKTSLEDAVRWSLDVALCRSVVAIRLPRRGVCLSREAASLSDAAILF
jgi:hypothetical protein